MFEDVQSDLVFYGHHHESSDIKGRRRYVNLGSAGCYDRAESRIGLIEIQGEKLSLKKESLVYEDKELLEEFERRKVPAREFIKKVFMKRE